MNRFFMHLTVVVAALMLTINTKTLASESNDWKLEIVPSLWYGGLEGNVEVDGERVDFDRSPGDVFEALERGGSLYMTLGKDRIRILGRMDYFLLHTDELDVEDRPKGGKISSKVLVTEAGGGYQFDGWSKGMTIDLLLGLRNLNIETKLEIFEDGKFQRTDNLTDPFLYVLPSVPILTKRVKRLRLNPLFALGGGGDSEFIYELFPQIQYHITDNIVTRIGYRSLGWKVKGKENNELNFRIAGPSIGIGITF